MNKNIFNTILIAEDKIIHFLILKKRTDKIISGISYFNYGKLENENLDNILSEISDSVTKNKLTHINLINEDILKYQFVLEKGETVNLRMEVLNRFKSAFEINISEYYIDYEVYEFRDYKIVFVAGVLRKFVDNLVNFFKKYKFRLISMEIDIISLKRLIKNFYKNNVVMNLHMRKNKTLFLVVENNILFTFRELNFGYENIVEYISEKLNKDKELVDTLLKTGKEELPISEAMDKFTIELQRTIDYYNSRFRYNPVSKLIITGELGKINKIERFLSELFLIETEKLNPLKDFFVDVENIDFNNLDYIPEVCGTSLRDL